MFSDAPSNEQNLIDTPSSPCPPHVLLGTMETSRVLRDLELYTTMFTGWSIYFCKICFRMSFSWFYKKQIETI